MLPTPSLGIRGFSFYDAKKVPGQPEPESHREPQFDATITPWQDAPLQSNHDAPRRASPIGPRPLTTAMTEFAGEVARRPMAGERALMLRAGRMPRRAVLQPLQRSSKAPESPKVERPVKARTAGLMLESPDNDRLRPFDFGESEVHRQEREEAATVY